MAASHVGIATSSTVTRKSITRAGPIPTFCACSHNRVLFCGPSAVSTLYDRLNSKSGMTAARCSSRINLVSYTETASAHMPIITAETPTSISGLILSRFRLISVITKSCRSYAGTPLTPRDAIPAVMSPLLSSCLGCLLVVRIGSLAASHQFSSPAAAYGRGCVKRSASVRRLFSAFVDFEQKKASCFHAGCS